MTYVESHCSFPEFILAAAVKHSDVIAFVERPGRHYNVLHGLYELSFGTLKGGEQGFITSHGRFVDREEGLLIAGMREQIVKKHGNGGMLFSEDMW